MSASGLAPESWGRYPRARHRVVPIHWRDENPFAREVPGPYLAYGLGRSYGDSCLNDGGTLLLARGLDRFISLDRERGLLACEAGVSLGAILRLVVPLGFFLPVVPGTKHVTIGGAIANDVHGKNHHRAGTFGCHVEEIELLRSTGERVICSRTQNRELFAATVGGIGLTGLVLAATIRLRRITTEKVLAETVPIRDLAEFLEVSRASDETNEFTVAWVDCLATGKGVGRGILHRGDHAEGASPPRALPGGARIAVPIEFPVSPLNRVTLKAFNLLYYARNRMRRGSHHVPYEGFFFPLDGIDRWNRIYGKAGLLQFQCAIPPGAAGEAIGDMLRAIARAGQGSFLAVLKNFGNVPSPGLLSFPRPGVTLALDFPNKGDTTARLFRELYAMVRANDGLVYPAKDAHMPSELFAHQYGPRLETFRRAIDPAFSSSFWRRVTNG